MTFGPIVPPSGPSPSSIMIIAEAPGEAESARLLPLIGPSGYELRRMLSTIGVDLNDCFKTNVFSRQPPGNDLSCYGTLTPQPALKALGPLTLNPITYLDEQHAHELTRLYAEIAACNPNVIIALGNTACWALLGQQGINALRGSVHVARIPGISRSIKVVPTYHPGAVIKQWDQRVIALADLEKAHVEARSPDFNFDNTELWIQPDLEDIREFDSLHMEGATICATDVETKRGQITCVSFAPTPDISLVIPFWIDGENPNYWPDVETEAAAWGFVRRWIEDPKLVKVLQNGLYDVQYFIAHGMKPRGFTEDTMLAHHSLYSELKKGLGFLGSIYSNSPSWKFMRTYRLEEQLKRDD